MSCPGNLTEHVYLYVRDRILRGELPFGAPLSRRVIAAEIGASIVPVGDALQRLENDGLVESRPRVGTRVRIPTVKSIRGHYILREALETQAARIFTAKASAEERAELRRMAVELDRLNAEVPDTGGAPERESAFRNHLFHMRFHMFIAECTGCDELCQAIEKNQILVFNWLYDTALGNLAPPPHWHQDLAGALLCGSPETADAAMRGHTRFRMEDVLSRIQPSLDWSKPRIEAFQHQRRKTAARGSKRRAASRPVTSQNPLAPDSDVH